MQIANRFAMLEVSVGELIMAVFAVAESAMRAQPMVLLAARI